MTEEFSWTDSDSVILRSYGDIAIYLNPHGDVVIRQASNMGEDDAVIIIPVTNVAAVAKAVRAAMLPESP